MKYGYRKPLTFIKIYEKVLNRMLEKSILDKILINPSSSGHYKVRPTNTGHQFRKNTFTDKICNTYHS